MKRITRQRFNQVMALLAAKYGVENVTEQFAIETPEVEDNFQDKIVEKEDFLGKINVIGVDELTGKNVLGYANGPVSGRTDTSVEGAERQPRDVLGMDKWEYLLHQVDSDVFILYKTLDMWAKKAAALGMSYTAYVQQQIANDRVMIGWYGETAAADTDIVANPLLQDVCPGWFEYMRANMAANLIDGSSGTQTVDEIHIGTGGDYENLDQAAHDLLSGIPLFLRKDMRVFVGDDLITSRNAGLYKLYGDKPSEKEGLAAAMSTIGGMPWETPSFFPGRAMVVTSHKNLSIYYQNGSWRRHLKDKPEKNRIEDFNSRNEGYVIEEPRAFTALEFKDGNVKVRNAAGDAWV